jgi:glucose-6-phosphate 1-dehydrogenase
VRGQYEGYRAEVGSQDTATETYAALELRINTPRWEGVPVVVRTGKALARKHTEIRIRFARAGAGTAVPNELVFQIQPGEGISLHLNAKKPGFSDELLPVEMDFNYDQSFESGGHPDAYERVLVDAARGDHTLFTTSQEVIAAWRIVENVLRAWEASAGDLVVYPKGSTTVGKL